MSDRKSGQCTLGTKRNDNCHATYYHGFIFRTLPLHLVHMVGILSIAHGRCYWGASSISIDTFEQP